MKKLTLFSLVAAALISLSGCQFIRDLINEEYLLYGQWDVAKVYEGEIELNYAETRYSFVFEKNGTFKFQIWESAAKTNMVIASYTGSFSYDKDKYILNISFPIDGLLQGKKDFNTNIVSQFQVKELTLKRLLLDVIEEDELAIFNLNSTWEMNKKF
ncbi:MAG TPA: hypothetical protein PK979_04465 [Bacteroidales bacterium]|nr:hypothetical protein [Bacteroidales bacterium]HPK30281.1 hypothetical protein [Bacteroidales bacterium]